MKNNPSGRVHHHHAQPGKSGNDLFHLRRNDVHVERAGGIAPEPALGIENRHGNLYRREVRPPSEADRAGAGSDRLNFL